MYINVCFMDKFQRRAHWIVCIKCEKLLGEGSLYSVQHVELGMEHLKARPVSVRDIKPISVVLFFLGWSSHKQKWFV